jgi:membrane protease YdiL (CAAX protease family)
MNRTSASTRVLIYLLLTFTFSSYFYVQGHRHGLTASIAIGIMWCPGVAAIITSLLTGRSLREIGWRWGATKYQFAAWVVPMLYAWPAYILVWATGLGGFPAAKIVTVLRERLHLGGASDTTTLVVGYIVTATVGMLFGCIGALGEEIGWRGFLVPELSRITSFTRLSLISGTIWALWHFPLIFFGNYNSGGTPRWFSASCFFIMVVGISFGFAWLRLKSGSMWTGMIMHAIHNAIIQSYLTPLTVSNSKTPWFIDEFGAAMLPFVILIAFYFWRKRTELPVARQRTAVA